jgi:hypothetical protein
MFVEACDALAQTFEQEGRPDLAALCDRASFWLSDQPLERMTLGELRRLCAEHATAPHDRAQEVGRALVTIGGVLETPEAMLDRAADFRALSILASWLLGGSA